MVTVSAITRRLIVRRKGSNLFLGSLTHPSKFSSMRFSKDYSQIYLEHCFLMSSEMGIP